MNSVSSRLKAIALTVLFFAASAFALLGVIWLLARLPVPGQSELAAYRPHDTIAVVTDLRLAVALTAGFLVAAAMTIALSSAYLDRTIAIFADVLLMYMAAAAGFVGGYWLLLRLAGYQNFLSWDFARVAIIPPAIVFVASLIPPHRARQNILVRGLLVVALVIAAPALLILAPI